MMKGSWRQVLDGFRKIPLLEQQIQEQELTVALKCIEYWSPNLHPNFAHFKQSYRFCYRRVNREAWTTSQLILLKPCVSEGYMCSCSCGRGSVGVEEHGVKGSGKVVRESAAVVVFWEGHQTRHNQQQQEEDVEGKSRSQNTIQQRPRRGQISLISPAEWTVTVVIVTQKKFSHHYS